MAYNWSQLAFVEPPRRWLDPGSRIPGKLLQLEDDTGLVDIGLPVVVQFPEGEMLPLPGQTLEFTVSETPRRFLVL